MRSISEDEISRLGEDVFLMCSRPNLLALAEFNIQTRPLPNEAAGTKGGTAIMIVSLSGDILCLTGGM